MVPRKSKMGARRSGVGPLTKSAMSLPLVKQSAVPCNTTARTAASACPARNAAVIATYIASDKAFFFSGRCRLIVRMASRISTWTLAEESGEDMAGRLGGTRQKVSHGRDNFRRKENFVMPAAVGLQ